MNDLQIPLQNQINQSIECRDRCLTTLLQNLQQDIGEQFGMLKRLQMIVHEVCDYRVIEVSVLLERKRLIN
jgi:hypothetical protein